MHRASDPAEIVLQLQPKFVGTKEQLLEPRIVDALATLL